MRIDQRQSGFTLIELLLSLSILSIILVIILGSLRIGLRAWEKGQTTAHAQQRSRTILDQLTRQLTSAAVVMGAQEERPLVPFNGDGRTVEFTASLPLIKKRHGRPVHVKYMVETGPSGKMRLLLYEDNIAGDGDLSTRPLSRGTEAHLLLEALEELRFEYLGAEGQGPDLNWASYWPGEHPTELPRAVRITYRDKKDDYRIRVIAPLRQWDRFREETRP